MPDAWLVHFHADVVLLRIFLRLLHERIAVAETDFKTYIRRVAEHAREIDRFLGEIEAVSRPEIHERLSLR